MDNGFNWTYGSALGASGKDLKMITPTSGYVLAVSFTGRKLVFTTDGGESFLETWAYAGPMLEAMYINSNNSFICAVGTAGRIVINRNFLTGIHEYFLENMSGFNLAQNYPNPFNPTTKISYQLPVNAHVTLKVYDLLGREMAILVNEEKQVGKYEAQFNASDLSSGVYLCKITMNDFVKTMKMIVIK